MKNGLLLMAAAAAACGAAPAAAQTATGLSLGLEVLDYNYRERDGGAPVVFDDGVMTGLDIGYTGHITHDLLFSVRVAGRTGEIDYRSDDGERLENIDQSVGQLDLRLVHDVRLSPRAVLSPFVGIGHRLLEDESGGATTAAGAAGYDREISYTYVPVGTTLSFGTSARSTVSFSAEYDFIVSSRFKTQLSDVDRSLPNLDLGGRGGHGVQVSATITRPIGRRRALEIGPFLRHWDVERSDSYRLTVPGATVEFFEPDNRTTEWGLRVGFRF